jgi:hypothetical protein
VLLRAGLSGSERPFYYKKSTGIAVGGDFLSKMKLFRRVREKFNHPQLRC